MLNVNSITTGDLGGTTKRAPRRKKSLFDRTPPNACRCYGYAATGKNGPKAKWPKTAYDLCQCQFQHLFRVAKNHPSSLADCCIGLFSATNEDIEHIEWVCLLNLREWVPEEDREFIPDDISGISLMEVLAIIHAGRDARDAKIAESVPEMAALIAARATGSEKAIRIAEEAYRVFRHKELCRRIGMTDEQFDYWHGDEAKRRASSVHHTH